MADEDTRPKAVKIDIDNYRPKKRKTLSTIGKEVVAKVKNTIDEILKPIGQDTKTDKPGNIHAQIQEKKSKKYEH